MSWMAFLSWSDGIRRGYLYRRLTWKTLCQGLCASGGCFKTGKAEANSPSRCQPLFSPRVAVVDAEQIKHLESHWGAVTSCGPDSPGCLVPNEVLFFVAGGSEVWERDEGMVQVRRRCGKAAEGSQGRYSCNVTSRPRVAVPSPRPQEPHTAGGSCSPGHGREARPHHWPCTKRLCPGGCWKLRAQRPPQRQRCLHSLQGLEGQAGVVLVGRVGQGLPFGVGMGVPWHVGWNVRWKVTYHPPRRWLSDLSFATPIGLLARFCFRALVSNYFWHLFFWGLLKALLSPTSRSVPSHTTFFSPHTPPFPAAPGGSPPSPPRPPASLSRTRTPIPLSAVGQRGGGRSQSRR